MLRRRRHSGWPGRRLTTLLVAAPVATAALAATPLAPAAAPGVPQPESLTAPARATEPVVLTGAQFPLWSAGPEVTARAPQPPTDYGVFDTQGHLPAMLRSDCYQASPTPDVNGWTDPNHGDHNCYQHSQLPVRTLPTGMGVDPQSLRGYRWTGSHFVQIPFQVDTKWTHYISNNASGFAFYSGVDQVLTYTFDREGFRFTTNAPFSAQDPAIVCQALPAGGQATTPDPNAGLIDTDEMAFMARDAGGQAPSGARLPAGILDAQEVAVADPVTGGRTFMYVMRTAMTHRGVYAVPPAYTAQNSPYVHYARDANADLFVYSQSSYSDYGAAPKGPVCTPDGQPVVGQGFKRDASGALVLDPGTYVQRRPLDNATVTTPRYRFRYDGRWVMDALQVSPDDRGLSTGDYGPSIVDRWKARAFQQSPGGNTPCCGYEEEQNNWGGSSQLMGERVGPVRVIRVTWGADSSTNNIRTEIFYPEEVRYQDELRVHPIPPLDGIYVQRDMAAGHVARYYNPYVPAGVAVDGLNDEAFGNLHAHVGPDGVSLSSSDTVGRTLAGVAGGPVSVGSPNDATCNSDGCIHGDFDVVDPTFSGPPGLLQWEEVDGPAGAVVERWNVHQVTPGAVPETLVTMPYYRDDSCFDDGTGTDPGPKLYARSKDEPTTWGYDPVTGVPVSPAPAGATPIPRRCWNHHADGTPYNLRGSLTYDPSKPAEQPDPAPDPSFSPQGDVRYYQGDIATHGLHVNLIVDSDNADTTVPVDEIDTEQRQVVLPPNQGNVGERYGHSFDKPLVAVPTRHIGALPVAPAKTAAPSGGTAAALPVTGVVAVASRPTRAPASPSPSLPPTVVLPAAAGVGGAALLRRLVLRR